MILPFKTSSDRQPAVFFAVVSARLTAHSAIFAAFALVVAAVSGLAAATPPNVIYILCDDLAQGDIGVYGQKIIQTPRLDQMAAEGTRFTRTYFPTYLWNDDQRIELAGNDGKSVGKIYAQNLIQKEAIDFVRSSKSKPFFLYYAITLPHANHEIDDLGLYADRPWSLREKSYAAQVTRIDSDVGALLDLLKELGIDDNTLVIITGDNGSSFPPDSEIGKRFNQANNGLRGHKRGLYEGALRQACIARWPGTVPAGRVSEEAWAFWDFLPTAAELAGQTVPAACKTDGLSLVAHLKGGPAPRRDFFYWELHEGTPIQAIRFGDWKAVKNGPAAKVELYNLTKDPGEQTDMAAAHPEQVEKALALMKQQHTPSADWPLDGKSPQRLSDQRALSGKPHR